MMQTASGGSDRPDRPRFRQDLVAEPVDEQGARFIDVMDPDSGTIFRFYEVEYSLACAMDGERDVPGIVKWAQEELGLSPSPQEVRTVIAALGDLGFIAAGEAIAQPLTSEPGPVVIAPRAKPAAATELEFGTAVSRAPVPPAPEVTLGASGSTAKRPVQAPDDSALASPGRSPPRPTPGPSQTSSSEVSIDLSDHIAVRPDDVKEAVRASRVLAAVDVPQDLLDAIENRSSSATAEPSEDAFDLPEATHPPESAVRAEAKEARAEAKEARAEAKMVEARAEAKEARAEAKEARAEAKLEARGAKAPITKQPDDTGTAKPPVELPRPPVAKPVQPPAPRARVSPALIVLLILAVLGGGGFAVWKYVLQKQGPSASTSTDPAPLPVKPQVAPPPPPPEPASKIVLETPAPDDVKITQPGQIETILPENAAVKKDDVVVRLVGDKPLEAEIAGITRDAKRLQAQLDAWTARRATALAAGNKAAVTAADNELTDRQKTMTAKQELLATKTEALKKFLLLAPSNGMFTPISKIGVKLAADDVVARVLHEAAPVATFKVSDAKPFTANASIEVTAGKGEQHVTCTISEVKPDSVKVVCPVDPALAEGADVRLRLGPAAAEAPPAPSAPAPSAPAPSAPAAGSSAAK